MYNLACVIHKWCYMNRLVILYSLPTAIVVAMSLVTREHDSRSLGLGHPADPMGSAAFLILNRARFMTVVFPSLTAENEQVDVQTPAPGTLGGVVKVPEHHGNHCCIVMGLPIGPFREFSAPKL